MRRPSAEIFPTRAWQRHRLFGAAHGRHGPEAGAALGAHVARPDANMTLAPSAVHPCTVSAAGCQVSRLGSPPSTGTTYTSVLPA